MSTTINSAQTFTLERNAFGRLVLTDAQGAVLTGTIASMNWG